MARPGQTPALFFLLSSQNPHPHDLPLNPPLLSLRATQVVAKDPFNSDPEDPELMSSEVRERLKAGESLPVGTMKIPMVRGDPKP